jgi:hypothetical protein
LKGGGQAREVHYTGAPGSIRMSVWLTIFGLCSHSVLSRTTGGADVLWYCSRTTPERTRPSIHRLLLISDTPVPPRTPLVSLAYPSPRLDSHSPCRSTVQSAPPRATRRSFPRSALSIYAPTTPSRFPTGNCIRLQIAQVAKTLSRRTRRLMTFDVWLLL